MPLPSLQLRGLDCSFPGCSLPSLGKLELLPVPHYQAVIFNEALWKIWAQRKETTLRERLAGTCSAATPAPLACLTAGPLHRPRLRPAAKHFGLLPMGGWSMVGISVCHPQRAQSRECKRLFFFFLTCNTLEKRNCNHTVLLRCAVNGTLVTRVRSLPPPP